MELQKKFKERGFIILEDLLKTEECEFYKNLLERDFELYSSKYANSNAQNINELSSKFKEKVVYNLHNKSLNWFKLFEHSKVIEILNKILSEGSYNNSEPFYLYNNSARCPLKGNIGQQLHIDSNLPGVNYCLVANVMWALDDFTIKNGATRIIPGSHNRKTYADNGKTYDDEILLELKKGSVVIFNANIWHGGGPNIDGSSRWAVLLGYSRWFIKPSFDYMKNTPSDIYQNLTLAQKKLLGFDLIPPKDEFSRLRRRSEIPEIPDNYKI